MTSLAEYKASRELLTHLTLRELRAKYKRSALGWAWSLVNPLVLMLIYTVVFRLFLKVRPPIGSPSGMDNFALFLLCGLLPWNFLLNGTTGSVTILLANSNLVKKTYFPRELLVTAHIASWLVSFLIEMLLLAVAMLVVGNVWLPFLPVIAVLIIALSAFTIGLGLAVSALNVYFRDVQYLLGVALQIWFFLTPVLYPVSLVPERATVLGVDLPVRALYHLNPMVGFTEAFRDCLYDLRFPPAVDLLVLLGVSLAALLGGLAVFKRLEPGLAEEL